MSMILSIITVQKKWGKDEGISKHQQKSDSLQLLLCGTQQRAMVSCSSTPLLRKIKMLVLFREHASNSEGTSSIHQVQKADISPFKSNSATLSLSGRTRKKMVVFLNISRCQILFIFIDVAHRKGPRAQPWLLALWCFHCRIL